MGRIAQFFHDYHNVARLEYAKAEAPAIFMPLLFTTYSLDGILKWYYFEAIIAFLLVYYAGFIINAYTDIAVDSRYKKYIARSASRIGARNLLRLFWLQCGIALLLTAHLSWFIGQWWILGLMGLLVFLAYAYSVPPFNFKTGGWIHCLAISLGAFMIPATFLFYISTWAVTLPMLVFVFGFTITHFGISLNNQSGDYLEDKAEGLLTPAVRWGLNRTLKAGFACLIGGLAILMMSFYLMIVASPWLEGLEAAMGIGVAGRFVFFIIACLIALAGYSIPIRGMWTILGYSGMDLPEKKIMKRIKARLNYPLWQGGGIWGVGAVSLAYFLVAVMF